MINNPSSKQLTYQPKTKKSILSEPSPKVVEHSKKQIKDVVKTFSAATKVSLHTKHCKKELPLKETVKQKKYNIQSLFIKISLALAVFVLLYFATIFLGKLFTGTKAKYDFKGTPSVVMCEECGNLEKKPVIDIWDSKCKKCGKQDWYAVKCGKCKKSFPLNESKFNDEDLYDEDFDADLDKVYACPFCKSNVPAKNNFQIKNKK
jgi:Zn finger protein HypA/HybF involved in hydrogenase expression